MNSIGRRRPHRATLVATSWRQTREVEQAHGHRSPEGGTQALARLAARNMQLQVTIQDGQVWVADERESVQLDPKTIFAAKPEWS